MAQRGFTIVELIITITIMGILILLAVVNVNGTQMQARDDERVADIEAIAVNLESFFTNDTRASASIPNGRYPSTGLVDLGPSTVLLDIDPKSYTAPGQTASSLIKATNADETITGVTPQPTIDQYLYQPLAFDGTNWIICTSGAQECRRYNLFYRLEKDTVVYIYKSKNQ